jgi:hypothetical protein
MKASQPSVVEPNSSAQPHLLGQLLTSTRPCSQPLASKELCWLGTPNLACEKQRIHLQGFQGGTDGALALPDFVHHPVQLGLKLPRILQRLLHLVRSTGPFFLPELSML